MLSKEGKNLKAIIEMKKNNKLEEEALKLHFSEECNQPCMKIEPLRAEMVKTGN